MFNIIAKSPSGMEIIVENFIKRKDRDSCLQWWKDNGMSFVNYICKRALLMDENLPSNKVAKEKRDSKH